MKKIKLFLFSWLVEQLVEEHNSAFAGQLGPCSGRLRQGKIRRGALVHPNESSFKKLFQSGGQDNTLVTLCGFDHSSFKKLHSKFQSFFLAPLFRKRADLFHIITKRGRMVSNNFHKVSYTGSIAWTRTPRSVAVLQMTFGITTGRLLFG
jgi:hypothetical protein